MLWTLGYIYLFKLVFPFSLDIFPGVELLDHMVVLLLAIWGTSILFSTVAILIYIPTMHKGFLFSTTLFLNIHILLYFFFNITWKSHTVLLWSQEYNFHLTHSFLISISLLSLMEEVFFFGSKRLREDGAKGKGCLILNPLLWARDWTYATAATWVTAEIMPDPYLTCCATVGTPKGRKESACTLFT